MDGKKEEILERRSKLSLAKQALLEKRLRGEVKSDSRLEVIPRRSNTGTVPLSFTQQRLWFLHQLEESGSAFYSEPTFLQMLGSLNVVALEQSLNEIVRRHESLRTTFETVEGQPMQVIAPGLTLTLRVVNLCHLPETEQQAQVQRLAIEEIQQPFDLEQAPLLRVKLLQLNDQEHLLLFIIHHIISDGWSLRVLIRELADLYQAFCDGKPSPLPELPIQYADFAVWQHQWLQGEVLKKQLSYWKQQLAGAPPILELPTDRPRPLVQSFRGATITFKLSPDLTSRLKSLSQKQGITPFMTLLAAFQTLLYRYSGQEDICVGSPIANRNRNETHGLIGCFVNTLVMRTNFSDNPSFLELLKRVQQVAQDAYAHEDLPFKRLVEELQVERNLSYQPLFQVMFVLQNSTKEDLVLPGLSLKQVSIDTGNAKFDLSLYMEDAEPELIGWWEYNTDLFDTATMTRMLEHFEILLEGIVTHPEQRVLNLPLLTKQQLHQQLVEWNNTQVDYPLDTSIHELFEAQVERTPDAVAIIFENEHLTYRELNKRANQLAHYLQNQGVSPGVLVGICVERSHQMVVGLLGILKADGAYVPFDPAYPQERISFMLQDAQVAVVLTQQELVATLPKHQAKVVCLDTDWRSITQEDEENLLSQTNANNIAYVIYTSGSTGKPKGVQITHCAVANFLTAMRQTPGLTERDIFLSVTTITFDIAGLEIYLPLIVGARLVVVNRQVTTDGTQLLAWLTHMSATVMQATPATWTLLLAAGLQKAHQLKILCGGEALSQTLGNELLARGAVVWNMYGPTETTIWSTANQIESGDGIISISCPIANTQLYVLNQYQQPLPIGVSGELHIGGAGLAWGYINRADLTAEKFIPNPFSDEPGARLYKTGDLVRYRQDGKLEFLGRIDHQVKVRGFRIELAEIEAALREHQAVREVVVLVREDDPGNKRLVAYVVLSQTLTISDLHHFMKEKLPEYMMPSAFLMLEVLPLTPNGKVDRRSLPKPDTARPDLEAAYTAPSTLTETVLAKIWSEVLGVEQVGIHDNFFELGGDSVLCIQVIARAKQAGLQLTAKQMFQHQIIAELAPVAGTTMLIQAEQVMITGSVPLTPIQHWFFEQNLPDRHHWNQAVLLEVRQIIDPVILQQALHQVFVHHDGLRLRFLQKESNWEQINAGSDKVVSIVRLDLSALSSEQQEAAIEAKMEELQPSLNLSSEPLVRVAVFDLGVQRFSRLLIIIHHLIVDGVSWGIILEDLHTAYQQLIQGGAIKLPLKTTSFKQWSERLREYALSKELRQELPYWLAESRKHIAPLPVNNPGGNNTVASSCTVSVTLSVEETQVLLQEAPQVYRTQVEDLLTTAVTLAMSQWTGERSLLVDLEGSGREDVFNDLNLSRTVGWFTTIFPVLLELGKAKHPEEALKSVKQQLRRISNQGIGYGLLRYLSEDVEITQQLQALPRAEFIFYYLGQLDRRIPGESMFRLAHLIPGLSCSPQGRRSHLVDCIGFVIGSQLQLDWTYSKNIHQRATINNLAQSCMETLRSLIAHCQSPEAGGFTPSDFPDVELSQEKLDKALAEIDFS